MEHHVVILGASYAGIAAMRELGNRSGVRITLVDKHPYHFFQTEGYELISGILPFEDTIVSLYAVCANYKNVIFLNKEVISISRDHKCVYLDNDELMYDTLVLALGSVTKHFECDTDVFNYSSGAKSLSGALRLKQFFENELYKRLESSKKAKENFNIIIGGAGLSGVEIAASMQYFFNRYYRRNALSCASLHIHLIASRETVLYGMKPGVIRSATKRLKKLRVKLHTHTRIVLINKHEISLSDGSKIEFDFMIFAGGTSIAPVLSGLDLPKNERGRFTVDRYLRSSLDKDIYMIGDVAALLDKKKKLLPPTAQTALQSGKIVGKNILCTLNGKKLKTADVKIKGIAIALGGHYATLDLGVVHINGYPAYLIKKVTEKLYKWPLWWLAYLGFKKIEACDI